FSRRLVRSASTATTSPPARFFTSVANAESKSPSVPAFTISTLWLIARAAASTSRTDALVDTLPGLTSTATRFGEPASLRKSSNCFGHSSPDLTVTPVALPPGRFMLATTPSSTKSLPVANTIGILEIAALFPLSLRQRRRQTARPHYCEPSRLLIPAADRIAHPPTGIRSQGSDHQYSRHHSSPVETPPPDARRTSVISRSGIRSPASPAVAPVRQAAKRLLSQQLF